MDYEIKEKVGLLAAAKATFAEDMRSTPLQVFYKKDVLKNFAKFTRHQVRGSLFFI